MSLFDDGMARFNRGEFFEAHEAFEERLEEAENDDRWELLLGLIQVAVGYHKAQSGHPGVERMLRLGLEKLAPLPAAAHGLDVGALRARVTEDLARLEHGEDLDQRLAAEPPRLTVVAS